MMPIKVTVEDMRAARCANCPPNTPCGDEVILSQRCHPGRGALVKFNKRTSELEIVCKICRRPIAHVVFAPSEIAS